MNEQYTGCSRSHTKLDTEFKTHRQYKEFEWYFVTIISSLLYILKIVYFLQTTKRKNIPRGVQSTGFIPHSSEYILLSTQDS